MGKKKKWTKKKKIITFILVLLAVIIVFNALKPKEVEVEKIETEAVQKRNIAKSISATGVVSTSDSKTVTGTLTGKEIKTVNVTEGQKVAVGDVICTFDTSDTQYNLAVTKENQNLSIAQGNIGTNGAQRNLNDVVKDRDDAAKDLDVLQKTKDGANTNLNNAQANLKNAQDTVSKLTAENQKLQADKNNIQKQIDAINNTPQVPDASVGGVSTPSTPDLNVANKTELEAQIAKIDTTIVNNNATISKTNASIPELEANVMDWQTKYNAAVAAYNQKDATKESLDKQVASLQDQVTTAQISTNLTANSSKTQIKSMQDQIADGVVKSTVNGTVTKVNVKAGDIYTGTAIATIEGCESFIVEAEIDEYDIPDVKVGMKVLIKTDATRDEELEGKIIYAAPSATQSQALAGVATTTTTGGSATYTVKISIDTPNDRLRLGMNAKLSIITDSRDNVWSVPFEAVHEREDGTQYIEILKNAETEEKQEINVTKGLEGTYYVEIISDELNENMQVVLPKVEAGNSLEELIGMMGADAGL